MILNRQNPMGLRYTLTEYPNPAYGSKTEVRLSGTGKKIIVDAPIERVSAMWYKWQMQDAMIQDAFKELSPEQREFLITGITPHE